MSQRCSKCQHSTIWCYNSADVQAVLATMPAWQVTTLCLALAILALHERLSSLLNSKDWCACQPTLIEALTTPCDMQG